MMFQPPHWPSPPRCWPPYPLPPEPDPVSLDDPVDWLSYSHHQLHDMITTGIDLTGAMEVSAQWARLGTELSEIGTALASIVERSAAAWEGEAADLARETIAALTHWANDTGTQATKVSACVTVEVDNVANARDAMPAPPYPDLQPPIQAFSTPGFTGAAGITEDQTRPIAVEQQLHQQAARTMERFQESSREVYGTVPQFSPPQVGGPLLVDPTPPAPQPTPPQSTPPQPPPPVLPAPGPGSGSPGGTTARPPGAPPPPARPGVSTAIDPAAPARSAATAGVAGAPGRGGQPGIGGVPAAGAGTGRAEDTEYKGAGYLREDEDVWGLHEGRTVPPVIGDSGRA